MEYTVSTFFAALPIAVLVLYFFRPIKEENIKWSILGFSVLIFVVLFIYLKIFIPTDFYTENTSVRGNVEPVSVVDHAKPTVEASNYVEPVIDWSSVLEWVYICLTAFLPAALYMFYIIAIDKKKPEPLGALLLAVLIGIIAAFSVSVIGYPLFIGGFQSELNKDFIDSLSVGFLQIAIPSELSKWLLLLVFLKLNKYYDENLDGIVYSVCLSMGFSGVLGIWFMSGFTGFSASMFLFKGITTSLILIPIHLMSGAVMGYYMAMGRRKRRFLNTICALIVPTLIDGLICSMLAMMGGDWWYYSIIGILLLVLSIAIYWKIIHLMRLDGIVVSY